MERRYASAAGKARVVCDNIAGMTGRHAAAEHQGVFDATPELHLGAADVTIANTTVVS
ncbi:MAG: hypothetical protein WBE80_12390 [Methylocella sp.]